MNGLGNLYLGASLLAISTLRAPADEAGGDAKASTTAAPREGGVQTTSVSIGADGKMVPQKKANPGTSANFTDGEVTTRQHTEDVSDAPQAEEGAEGEASGDKGGAEGDAPDKDADVDGAEKDALKADGEEQAPLPDFDADKPEVLEAYDARFYKEQDGRPVLDIDGALGNEVYANSQKKDADGNVVGKAELNEGTYKWLEARHGVTREQADEVIAGRVALAKEKNDNFYKAVGGKENYDSQLAWGSANYTPEQKAKFNAALAKGGADAAEAIELLQSRAEKGGWKPVKAGEALTPAPKPEGTKKPLGAPKRPLSPAKSAAGAEVRTGGSSKGYANNDEYVAALKAAGQDKAKQKEVSANLAASTYWRPRKG